MVIPCGLLTSAEMDPSTRCRMVHASHSAAMETSCCVAGARGATATSQSIQTAEGRNRMTDYYLRFVSQRGQTHYFVIHHDEKESSIPLLTPEIINRLLLSVPAAQRRRDGKDWNKFPHIDCSPELEESYREQVRGRGTPLGDSTPVFGRPLTPFGVELRSLPGLKPPVSAPVVDLTDYHRHLRKALAALSRIVEKDAAELAGVMKLSEGADLIFTVETYPNSLKPKIAIFVSSATRIKGKKIAKGEPIERWVFELKEDEK